MDVLGSIPEPLLVTDVALFGVAVLCDPIDSNDLLGLPCGKRPEPAPAPAPALDGPEIGDMLAGGGGTVKNDESLFARLLLFPVWIGAG